MKNNKKKNHKNDKNDKNKNKNKNKNQQQQQQEQEQQQQQQQQQRQRQRQQRQQQQNHFKYPEIYSVFWFSHAPFYSHVYYICVILCPQFIFLIYLLCFAPTWAPSRLSVVSPEITWNQYIQKINKRIISKN